MGKVKAYAELVATATFACSYLQLHGADELAQKLAKATDVYNDTLKLTPQTDSGSLTDKDRAIIVMWSIIGGYQRGTPPSDFQLEFLEQLLGFRP